MEQFIPQENVKNNKITRWQLIVLLADYDTNKDTQVNREIRERDIQIGPFLNRCHLKTRKYAYTKTCAL